MKTIIAALTFLLIPLLPQIVFSSTKNIDSRVVDLLVDGIVADDIILGYYYVPDMFFTVNGGGHQAQIDLVNSIDKDYKTNYALAFINWALQPCNGDGYALIHQTTWSLGISDKAYLYLGDKSEWILAIKHPDQRESVGNFQEMLESQGSLNEQNFFAIHNEPLDQEFPYDSNPFVPRVYAAINLSWSSEFSDIQSWVPQYRGDNDELIEDIQLLEIFYRLAYRQANDVSAEDKENFIDSLDTDLGKAIGKILLYERLAK